MHKEVRYNSERNGCEAAREFNSRPRQLIHYNVILKKYYFFQGVVFLAFRLLEDMISQVTKKELRNVKRKMQKQQRYDNCRLPYNLVLKAVNVLGLKDLGYFMPSSMVGPNVEMIVQVQMLQIARLNQTKMKCLMFIVLIRLNDTHYIVCHNVNKYVYYK